MMAMASTGSKRPAAVLLGTNWGVPPPPTERQGQQCGCVACTYRKPQLKEKIQEKIRNGHGKHYCEAFCGGSRAAGDGKPTDCKKHGKVTVCSGCYRLIEPMWVMDKSKRLRLICDEGYTLEQLVSLNTELQEMAAALE